MPRRLQIVTMNTVHLNKRCASLCTAPIENAQLVHFFFLLFKYPDEPESHNCLFNGQQIILEHTSTIGDDSLSDNKFRLGAIGEEENDLKIYFQV